MILISRPALARLRTLLTEHPDDQVVRITLQDLDDHRLNFSITLEAAAQASDEVQVTEGVTVAIESHSAPRMDGMTLDYREADGFRFLHPRAPEDLTLLPPSLN